jgi:hypothetical protein
MLESEERELHAPWYHWLESGQPLVTGLVGAGLNGIFELSEQERAPLHRFGNRYDGELSGNKVVLSGGGEVAIDPNPKILLQRLGASNIQSLLISSTSQVEKFLSAGLLSRLLSVHASKFSSKPVEFPRARLALLRLRPREAVSVYKVLS